MRTVQLLAITALLAACGGKDGPGTTNTATGIPGTGTNAQPPNAQGDAGTVDEGGSVELALSANDLLGTNPLDLASITIVDPPAAGSATPGASGSVTYTHDGSEGPTDSFTYTIADSPRTSRRCSSASTR